MSDGPKRKHRWLIEIPGINSFSIKTSNRPSFHRNREGEIIYDDLEIVFYDLVQESTTKVLYDWMFKEPKDIYKNCELKLIDKEGKIIEHWTLFDCFPVFINFGTLSYLEKEPLEIKLVLRYRHTVLNF